MFRILLLRFVFVLFLILYSDNLINFVFNFSCDRQLLASHIRKISSAGLIIAVLKVILVVGDEGARSHQRIYNIDDDDDDDYDFGRMNKTKQNGKLSDFANHTLKQICSQEWVHNRCLQVRHLSID